MSVIDSVMGGGKASESFEDAMVNAAMNNHNMMQSVLKQFTSALEKQQKEHKQKMDEANAESA